MHSSLRLLSCVLALAASSAAQSICVSFNSNRALPNTTIQSGTVFFVLAGYEYAYEVVAPTDLDVMGFEMPVGYSSACSVGPEIVQTALFLQAPGGGPAATPVVTSTMTLQRDVAWWTETVFPASVRITAGSRFYLGFRHPGGGACMFKNISFDGSAPTALEYDRIIGTTPWIGPCPLPGSPCRALMWRVLCCSGPVITNQPSDRTRCEGSSVSMSVSATGSPPPSYQWRRNGVAVSGATSATYTFNATLARNGSLFDCVVRNACGAVISNAARLTVLFPPTITSQPGSRSECDGRLTVFTVLADGSAPFAYQWRRDAVNIPGETGSSYGVTATVALNGAVFDCVVSNSCDSQTSAPATLTVSSPPVITTHPASSSVCTGSGLTLSVVAQGQDLVYQWRKDGTPIAGANAASFAIPVVAPTDAGRYACRVTNACGALTSNEAVITVLQAPTASFVASTVSGCPPLTVTFFDQSAGSIREWRWDFDANGTIDSFAQNPTWVYRESGTYGVRLTVIGTSGCPSTLLRSGYIRALDTATPDFSATPTTGNIPLTVAFVDRTTGSPATWAWDLDNDGVTDSTARNPSFTYVEPGVYDVRLTVTSAITGCPSSIVMPFFVTAIGPTSNTLSPQILQYQFDEVRGSAVANTASETRVRPFGTVTVAGWQADPGRAGFRGNEPGAGCLGRATQPPAPSVVTGWSPRITGDYTVMWWQRMYAPASGGQQHYLWQSTGSGRPFECVLESDGLLTCVFRDGSGGRQQSLVTSETRVDQRLGTWMHVALVVDRGAGTARFFVDGQPENRSRSFTPDPGELTPGDDLVLGGPHPTNGSQHAQAFTLLADIDDFRVYDGARSGAQIQNDMLAEVATGGHYANGCPGPAGVPRIAANGPPVLPSPTLAITLRRAQPGVPAALLVGFTARAWDSITLPLDLSPVGFQGCLLETAAHLVFGTSTGSGDITLPLPLPNDPSLAGAHVYAQWLVFGTPGATSAGFDLNLQR